MKNKGNAKAQYSKTVIFNAFIELLAEKKFDEVTIQEISNKAMISRKTFYRNFDNKLDVLAIEVYQIGEEYTDHLNKSNDLEFPTIAYLIFKTMEQHIPFLKVLVQNDLNYFLMDYLYQQVVQVYRIKKQALLIKYGEETVLQSLLFSFGGFEKLLTIWLNSENPHSSEDIRKRFEMILDLFIESFT